MRDSRRLGLGVLGLVAQFYSVGDLWVGLYVCWAASNWKYLDLVVVRIFEYFEYHDLKFEILVIISGSVG